METQECTLGEMNPCEPPKKPGSLWGITYHAYTDDDKSYDGTAVVIAKDAHEAEIIFKTNSVFNGNQSLITVRAIAQIPIFTESGLCMEAYSNGTHAFLNTMN